MPSHRFAQEKRHFQTKMNREADEEAKDHQTEVAKRRIEPKFTSVEDRPHGKRCMSEEEVYAQARDQATRAHDRRGCRHFEVKPNGDTREFPAGGKCVIGLEHMAQSRSQQETPLEATFGRITRLTEDQLKARAEPRPLRQSEAIEYTEGFYKAGACVPAVDMHSKSVKSGFGFQGQDLKAKRISEKLWQARGAGVGGATANQAADPSKWKTYQEVERERRLQYEQRLVSALPDEYVPPVEEFAAPPPAEETPPETKKEKRAREKMAAKNQQGKQLATH